MDRKKAERSIENAGIAGILCGLLFLINILFAMLFLKVAFGTLGIAFWFLLPVLIIFGLTYGIFKKSRACAVIMFIYFLNMQLGQWIQSGNLLWVPLTIIFGYFFFKGILGTFAYHKIIKQKQEVDTTQ